MKLFKSNWLALIYNFFYMLNFFNSLKYIVCCSEMLFVIQNDILTAKPRNLDAEIVF